MHRYEQHHRYDKMVYYLWAYVILLYLMGFVLDTPQNILDGLIRIVLCEDALITDYVLVAGPGAAIINSAIVSTISLLMLQYSNDTLNGMTPVVMGLMSGFSLFGKNPVNIWPMMLGTWLYTKYRKEPFGPYANIGLMATALAPVVSYIILDNGWGTPIGGFLMGVVIGFIMPPLTSYTYRIQNGMNLYNVGFACGLVAFVCVPLISSMGAAPETQYHWASGYNVHFAVVLSFLCTLLIVTGLFFSGKPAWAAWAGYRWLLESSGRAPSDFLRMYGHPAVLINSGINGFIGILFIFCVGGNLNGPTVGGILCIIGFSAYGKHAKNILPVMAGVALGGFVMHWSLNDPAVQLACLFCTTLAPISGYFGWRWGILAGFLHSSVVLYTSSPVAGMNLYNNGFSGGLIAIILYPVILAIQHRRPELQEDDFMDDLEEDFPITPPEPHIIVEHMEEDAPSPEK